MRKTSWTEIEIYKDKSIEVIFLTAEGEGWLISKKASVALEGRDFMEGLCGRLSRKNTVAKTTNCPIGSSLSFFLTAPLRGLLGMAPGVKTTFPRLHCS